MGKQTTRNTGWTLWFCAIVIISVAVFFACADAEAKNSKKDDLLVSAEEGTEPMVTQTVSGIVCGKTKRGFQVLYDVDKKTGAEMLMWLPFSNDVDLQNYQTADEIELGDSVTVFYEETQTGGFKRSAKKVGLVKKPSKKDNPYYEDAEIVEEVAS